MPPDEQTNGTIEATISADDLGAHLERMHELLGRWDPDGDAVPATSIPRLDPLSYTYATAGPAYVSRSEINDMLASLQPETELRINILDQVARMPDQEKRELLLILIDSFTKLEPEIKSPPQVNQLKDHLKNILSRRQKNNVVKSS